MGGLEGGRSLQETAQSSLAGVLDLKAVDTESGLLHLNQGYLPTDEFLGISERMVTFSSGVSQSTNHTD